MRRQFFDGLFSGLRVTWPIISALLGAMVAMGVVVGLVEGWPLRDSIYFAFVSGLTIGYGDLAAKTLIGRALAIFIGMCGILLTGLVAAIAVKALTAVSHADDEH